VDRRLFAESKQSDSLQQAAGRFNNIFMFGGGEGIRTPDTADMSRML
jgi:hypothetical protein